jgi:hypothetical protein
MNRLRLFSSQHPHIATTSSRLFLAVLWLAAISGALFAWNAIFLHIGAGTGAVILAFCVMALVVWAIR